MIRTLPHFTHSSDDKGTQPVKWKSTPESRATETGVFGVSDGGGDGGWRWQVVAGGGGYFVLRLGLL